MPQRDHHYRVRVEWTGNLGQGTRAYGGYSRAHRLLVAGKPAIEGSSDPLFRGDASRWSPEEMLVAALAACHQLWYLHLCADAGVTVLSYEDEAQGYMREQADGAGQFHEVTLQPRVSIAGADELQRAYELHAEAHARCFIARSVNFPVTHRATVTVRTP